jgi:branched-chain amino acid transport system ATP-binding protein
MDERDPSPLLTCRSVSKYFGALAAVKALSFEVSRGEVLGIGGPNGAGKTTLFDLISGLNPADDGEVNLAGTTITEAPEHRICHLGLARTFQLNAAFDTLTARENVLIGSIYGHSTRAMPPLLYERAAVRRADEALEFTGMADRAHTVVRDLPVLDRKLLMIASALATEPKLLLMDEPVGGLNPHEIDHIMDLMRKVVAQGITMIVIEHVMRFLVQLSSRVMIMHHGEKIYEGSPAGLSQDRTVAQVYLGEATAARIADFIAEAG